MDERTAQLVFLRKVHAKLDEAREADGDLVKLRLLLENIRAIAETHREIEWPRRSNNSQPTPFEVCIGGILAVASLNTKEQPVLMDMESRFDHIRELLRAIPVQ
jgi:hypothetical protein